MNEFSRKVELLLSTIYSLSSGYWELLLECIRILPYTFAFDHINYAHDLSVMPADMIQLANGFQISTWNLWVGNLLSSSLKNPTFHISRQTK